MKSWITLLMFVGLVVGCGQTEKTDSKESVGPTDDLESARLDVVLAEEELAQNGIRFKAAKKEDLDGAIVLKYSIDEDYRQKAGQVDRADMKFAMKSYLTAAETLIRKSRESKKLQDKVTSATKSKELLAMIEKKAIIETEIEIMDRAKETPKLTPPSSGAAATVQPDIQVRPSSTN